MTTTVDQILKEAETMLPELHVAILADEVKRLRAWKAEASQVFASLQLTEIAKEIDVPLGGGVVEKILPWIKEAKRGRAELGGKR